MAFIIFGNGCLEVNLKRTVIYLTSIGYKLMAIAASVVAIIFTIFLIFHYFEIPWYAIAFMCCISLFCMFACYLCFNHRIIVNQNKSIIKCCALKTITILVADLQSIEVSTQNSINKLKFCNIIFILKSGQQVVMSGYDSIIKNKSVFRTEQKVGQLKNLLSTYKEDEQT